MCKVPQPVMVQRPCHLKHRYPIFTLSFVFFTRTTKMPFGYQSPTSPGLSWIILHQRTSIRWVWWHRPVILDTWEAEAGGWNVRVTPGLDWSKASLGKWVRPCLISYKIFTKRGQWHTSVVEYLFIMSKTLWPRAKGMKSLLAFTALGQ